jgi:hypothetical protein
MLWNLIKPATESMMAKRLDERTRLNIVKLRMEGQTTAGKSAKAHALQSDA